MTNLWQIDSTDSTVIVYDAGGTARDLSGDLNEVSFGWIEDDPEGTTFAQGAAQRVPGVVDADLSGTGVYSTQNNTGIDAVLAGIMAASSLALIHYFPAGLQHAGARYSGCYLMLGWEIGAQQGQTAIASWAFELASGSVSREAIPGGPGPFIVGQGIVGTHYIGV